MSYESEWLNIYFRWRNEKQISHEQKSTFGFPRVFEAEIIKFLPQPGSAVKLPSSNPIAHINNKIDLQK